MNGGGNGQQTPDHELSTITVTPITVHTPNPGIAKKKQGRSVPALQFNIFSKPDPGLENPAIRRSDACFAPD